MVRTQQMLLLTVVSFGQACAHKTASTSPVAAELPRWIQVDSALYVAVRTAEVIRMSIGMRYVNYGDRTIYLPDCKGEANPPFFEKKTAHGWVIAYPLVQSGGCLSKGIALKPGDSLSYTYQVEGILPNPIVGSTYIENVPGTYRFRWYAFEASPFPDVAGRGDSPPIFERISNEFEIVEK